MTYKEIWQTATECAKATKKACQRLFWVMGFDSREIKLFKKAYARAMGNELKEEKE